MTVKVSSGINPCKLYGLCSPGISMVSAVSPLLELPCMLHNHFQLPSCSLTQSYNSRCHPPCSRGLFGSSSARVGTSFPAELHIPGGAGGTRCRCHGSVQRYPPGCQDETSAHKTPQAQKPGDRAQTPNTALTSPSFARAGGGSSTACYRNPPCPQTA